MDVKTSLIKQLKDETVYFSSEIDPQGRTIKGKPVVIATLDINHVGDRKLEETAVEVVNGYIQVIDYFDENDYALCVVVDGTKLRGMPKMPKLTSLIAEQRKISLQVVASDHGLIKSLLGLFSFRNSHLYGVHSLDEAKIRFESELDKMSDKPKPVT